MQDIITAAMENSASLLWPGCSLYVVVSVAAVSRGESVRVYVCIHMYVYIWWLSETKHGSCLVFFCHFIGLW